MLITLNTTPSRVYLQGKSPSGSPALTGYRMRLISNYSNNSINNNNIISTPWTYFPLTKVDDYDTWYSYDITWTDDFLETFDGSDEYYTAIFEYNDNKVWVESETRLVKLVNRYPQQLFDEYLSNNEGNVMFVNYTEND
jgi:hypothetical protein